MYFIQYNYNLLPLDVFDEVSKFCIPSTPFGSFDEFRIPKSFFVAFGQYFG